MYIIKPYFKWRILFTHIRQYLSEFTFKQIWFTNGELLSRRLVFFQLNRFPLDREVTFLSESKLSLSIACFRRSITKLSLCVSHMRETIIMREDTAFLCLACRKFCICSSECTLHKLLKAIIRTTVPYKLGFYLRGGPT